MPHTHPVLIAEDDADTVFLLERSLRKLGVKNPIKIVHDGEEALRYLEEEDTHKAPRVALLDAKMPLKDGFAVLKHVRTNPKLSRLPVVMFSNSAEERDINRAYDLGANSYVVKPSDPALLHESLAKIHDYWININARPTVS